MATPQTPSAPRTNNIVVVGCKLPHGLIIDLYEPGTNEHGQKIMLAKHQPVTLKGANSSNIVGGFGLTEVDAEYWDAWAKQNAKFPAVVNGLIFAQDRRDRAADNAMDHAEAKSGFEGLDPENPVKGMKRVPKKEMEAAAREAA
jgi:hypothetical protein